MKQIIILWTLGVLILVAGVQSEMDVAITNITFENAAGEEITEIDAGERLYIDVTIENRGNVDLHRRRIRLYTRHVESWSYSASYPTTWDFENSLWLSPGDSTTHNVSQVIYDHAAAGNTQVRVYVYECDSGFGNCHNPTPTGGSLYRDAYITVNNEPDDYACVKITGGAYPSGHTIDLCPACVDGLYTFDVENCNNENPVDVRLDLYHGSPPTHYFQETDPIDDESFFTLQPEGEVGDSVGRTAVADSSLFTVPGKTVYDYFNVYYDNNGDWEKLRYIGSHFHTSGEYVPTSYGISFKQFYTEKAVYRRGSPITCTLVLKNDGITLPDTSFVEFTAMDASGAVFDTDTYNFNAPIPYGETVTVPCTMAASIAGPYLVSFSIRAHFKSDDSGSPDVDKEITLAHRLSVNIGKECDPVIPEVTPESGGLAVHRCIKTNRDDEIGVYVFPKFFFFDHLEQLGADGTPCGNDCDARFVWMPIKDTSIYGTGRMGIICEGEQGIHFDVFFTPAVTSMSVDPVPILLLVALVIALATLVHMRRKKTKKEKKAKSRKKPAKTGKKKKTRKKG